MKPLYVLLCAVSLFSQVSQASFSCEGLFSNHQLKFGQKSSPAPSLSFFERLPGEVERLRRHGVTEEPSTTAKSLELPAYENKNILEDPSEFDCLLTLTSHSIASLKGPDNKFEFIKLAGRMRKVPNGYELNLFDGSQVLLGENFVNSIEWGPQFVKFYRKNSLSSRFSIAGKAKEVIDLSDHDYAKRLNVIRSGFNRTGEIYSPEFFDWFSSHTIETHRLLHQLYDLHNPKLLVERVENELGNQYLSLFLHPGVVSRWGEALEFFKELKRTRPALTQYQFYKLFESKVGRVRLYRGLILTEEQAAEIKKKGLFPQTWKNDFVLGHFFSETYKDANFQMAAGEGVWKRAARGNSGWKSQLIQSYTKVFDVATSVPYWLEIATYNEDVPYSSDGKTQLRNGRHLYVVEAEVPLWDISYGKDAYQPYKLDIGDKSYETDRDPDFEQFLSTTLGPQDIISIQRIDVEPKKFSLSHNRDRRR